MGFIGSIIATVLMGGLIGFAGRAILPGAQDIGLPKTVGLGVVSSFIVSLILGTTSFIASVIVGGLVAAGLLWLGIRQGFLKA